MNDILTTTVAVAVHRRSESPIFGEGTLRVELDDDAAGPYVVLTCVNNGEENRPGLRMDMDELDAVTVAARGMMDAFPNDGEVTDA